MTPVRRIRVLSAFVIGALTLSGGCKSTGDPFLDALLCEVFGVQFVPDGFFSVSDGETFNLSAYILRSNNCGSNGLFSATPSDFGAMDLGGVTFSLVDPLFAPPGVQTPRNNDEQLLRATLPVTLNLAGNFGLELRYTLDEADFDATRSLNFAAQAARGVINVQITGLPPGVPGNVRVDNSVNERVFTSSGSGKFFAGNIPWQAFSVFGPDGTGYVPSPESGTIPLAIGGTQSLSVMYSADSPAMGMVNLGIAGLPAGVTGGVTVTGNGFNQTFTGSSWVPLEAGVYMFTSNTASDPINDYNDPQPTRQVMVTAGQTVDVLFAYAIIATLVNLNVQGLESGLSPLITLTKGMETRTVSSNTASLKLALGLWTVALANRLISGRTYVGTGGSPATINVLAQTAAMSLVLAYYCSTFQWNIAATLGIVSDSFGHAAFINMLLTAHILTLLWLFPDPDPLIPPGAIGRADQTTPQQTVTISGQGAFVQVTGTRATNGTLNLSGSGTVAGFPDVPVVLTGTLTNAGALTNVQYRMGQSQAPTGLPNGPIIYSISSPAPPGFDFLGGALSGVISR